MIFSNLNCCGIVKSVNVNICCGTARLVVLSSRAEPNGLNGFKPNGLNGFKRRATAVLKSK